MDLFFVANEPILWYNSYRGNMKDKFERSRSMPSWFRDSDIDVLEAVRRAAARIEAGVPYPEPFEVEDKAE